MYPIDPVFLIVSNSQVQKIQSWKLGLLISNFMSNITKFLKTILILQDIIFKIEISRIYQKHKKKKEKKLKWIEIIDVHDMGNVGNVLFHIFLFFKTSLW